MFGFEKSLNENVRKKKIIRKSRRKIKNKFKINKIFLYIILIFFNLFDLFI